MTLPKTPSFRLDGQKALVVGASSGIGLACGVALAEAGADVTMAARRPDLLEDVVAQMQDAGLSARSMVLDVTDINATKQLVDAHGPFEILVNSAGLARHSAALDTQLGDYDAVMDLNVKAAYFLTQTVAAGLISAKKPGSLINISSQMAHVGGIDRAVYCATKHAVEGFTKAMAIEFGPSNVRVNTICPTFVLTELSRPTFEDPDKRAWIERMIKLDRVGTVEDIMGAVTFLASKASSLVTGTSILIDGGWTAE